MNLGKGIRRDICAVFAVLAKDEFYSPREVFNGLSEEHTLDAVRMALEAMNRDGMVELNIMSASGANMFRRVTKSKNIKVEKMAGSSIMDILEKTEASSDNGSDVFAAIDALGAKLNPIEPENMGLWLKVLDQLGNITESSISDVLSDIAGHLKQETVQGESNE